MGKSRMSENGNGKQSFIDFYREMKIAQITGASVISHLF